jgi:hypothetical protein
LSDDRIAAAAEADLTRRITLYSSFRTFSDHSERRADRYLVFCVKQGEEVVNRKELPDVLRTIVPVLITVLVFLGSIHSIALPNLEKYLLAYRKDMVRNWCGPPTSVGQLRDRVQLGNSTGRKRNGGRSAASAPCAWFRITKTIFGSTT